MGLPPAESKRLWRLSRERGRPLYQQIQELIMSHIQSGVLKPGDLLPSYPWLSRTMGVADKTVRQAYANLQQAGVLEIMRGKGTFVARERVGRADEGALRTGVVGVVPPTLPAQASEEPLLWLILRAIQEAAYAERLDTLLLARAGDLRAPGTAERLADPKRLDGLILLTTPVDELLQRLVTLNVPVVLAGAASDEVQVDSVTFEMAQIGRDLTYRLIGEGHRRIGLVRVPRGRQAADFEDGYRHAMGSAELPVRPSWVVNVDVDLGETGGSAVSALLEEGVTAILAYSCPLAIAAAGEADRKGLSIPQALSLASVLTSEDVILSSGVKLEGALLEASDLGRAAVRRIMQLLSEEDTIPRREGVEARVVKGGSIGPVPGGPPTA